TPPSRAWTGATPALRRAKPFVHSCRSRGHRVASPATDPTPSERTTTASSMSHLQAVPASPPSTPSEAAAAQRHHNEGHGRRLTAAFEALEAFPALAESRNRVLRLFTQERTSPADIVAAVESDVALAIAVIRLANQADGKTKGKVESVVTAVEVLSPEAVHALAAPAPRAPRAGRGPRAGGRRPGPPLGAAEGHRLHDRAPPRRGRLRGGGPGPAGRHAGPLRPGRGDLPGRAAEDRAPDRDFA